MKGKGGGGGQWKVAAAEVDDCGHVVPLGGKAQHNRAEQSGQRSSSGSTVLSLGVPVQVYPVASAWQLATGNGQQRLWGPDWAEL